MQIHDFYSKLTSATEESRLFQALRSLSQVDNPKSITEDPGAVNTEWSAWPSLQANTANLAA